MSTQRVGAPANERKIVTEARPTGVENDIGFIAFV
jgi:hypothetical protein